MTLKIVGILYQDKLKMILATWWIKYKGKAKN